jgi:hypothetical protein
MTERKPPEMSFTSWVDQQISEAEKRGAFDNLPGTGKPLPNLGAADHGQVWLRDYLRREGVSSEEFLPAPLKLRKQRERLAEGVQNLRCEQEVRDAVQELNRLIIDSRRNPEGPPIFVPRVNEEAMVAQWKAARTASSPAPPAAGADAESRKAAGTDAKPREDAAAKSGGDPARKTAGDPAAKAEGASPLRRGWRRRLSRRGHS